jgi:16S rRNA (uracil1498-N3)-methyltransferase
VTHRFHVVRTAIRNGIARVEGAEFEHLSRVLRLGPGDEVTLFDDTGWEYEGRIRAMDWDRAEVGIAGQKLSKSDPEFSIELCQGLPKGTKMDLIVEKTTELGVQKIMPFESEFTVTRSEADRDRKKVSRWERVALSAAKQCGRARIPEIAPISSFDSVIAMPPETSLKVIFWERERDLTLGRIAAQAPRPGSAFLVVGAEGGFSPDEIERAKEKGFLPVGLGPRRLRCETAAVAAVALVQHLWGDLS